MAELAEDINKLEAVDHTSKLSSLEVSVPDFVVLRFELDDSTSNVPSCARDLLFNFEMQEEPQGSHRRGRATRLGSQVCTNWNSPPSGAAASPEAVAQALGRRTMRDIQIETYTPNGND